MKKKKKIKYALVHTIYYYMKKEHKELFKTYQFQTLNQKYTLKEIF